MGKMLHYLTAGCVVVLWSAESVQSQWVLYEARHGQRAGKLIQALLEPLQPPAEFASLAGSCVSPGLPPPTTAVRVIFVHCTPSVR